MYENLAKKYYKNHSKYKKALSAGIAMDNALKLHYTKGGHSNCFFMMSNYLKYFDYQALKNNNLI